MSKLTARQAEAIRETTLNTSIVPSWVHGHTLRALRDKGLVRPIVGGHLLTDEGRATRTRLLAKEGR